MNDNETSLQHNGLPARHSWWESLRDDLADRFSLSEDSARQEETVDMICRGVEFRGTNLWVLIFATMIASLGLNVNSAAVIIGAMLVSPLMGPIMGVGLSLGINDFDLLKKSLRNFSLMVVVAIATSTLYFFISPLGTARSELLARTVPTTYDVLIAFFGRPSVRRASVLRRGSSSSSSAPSTSFSSIRSSSRWRPTWSSGC